MSRDGGTMKRAALSLASAGTAALVAAGLAVAPAAQDATEALRTVHFSDINLLATPTPVEAAITLAQGLADSAGRLVQDAAQAPLGVIQIAQALIGGNQQDLYLAIRQYNGAPLWIADPSIAALENVLPSKLGGDVSWIRNYVLSGATSVVRGGIAAVLGVNPDTGVPLANPLTLGQLVSSDADAARAVADGVEQSAMRFAEGLALAPSGIASIAQAIAHHDNVALYVAIRQFNDGPLWAVDPTIEALNDVLPAPLGQGTDYFLGGINSVITGFRNSVLWQATSDVRTVIARMLGVDPSLNAVPPSSASVQRSDITQTVLSSASTVGVRVPRLQARPNTATGATGTIRKAHAGGQGRTALPATKAGPTKAGPTKAGPTKAGVRAGAAKAATRKKV
jgi:hypothetical protein